jgi:hypothetical protein
MEQLQLEEQEVPALTHGHFLVLQPPLQAQKCAAPTAHTAAIIAASKVQGRVGQLEHPASS